MTGVRFIVFGSTAFVITIALLLFDDMDIALPVIVLLVWAVVLVAGLLVVRLRARRRRDPSLPRRPRRIRRIAWRRAPKPLALPRR